MFKLNRLTDYAVVVMSQMARRPDQMRTAPQIAQDTAVPLPTVAKLLNALANGQLITSRRGPRAAIPWCARPRRSRWPRSSRPSKARLP